MVKHPILVIRYGIKDPYIIGHSRPRHIDVRYHTRFGFFKLLCKEVITRIVIHYTLTLTNILTVSLFSTPFLVF